MFVIRCTMLRLNSCYLDGRMEKLLDHLHVDRQEVGVNTTTEKIDSIMGQNIKSQKRRLNHRWLSRFSLVEQLHQELDVFTV